MKQERKSSGFTLVELVVVIAILGIVAVSLVPAYIRYVDKSRLAVCKSARAELIHAYKIETHTGASGDYADLIRATAQSTGMTVTDESGTTLKLTGGCPSDGEYTLVYSYSTGEIESITCSKHDESDSDKGSSFADFSDNFLTALNKSGASGSIDSTAPEGTNTNQQKILSELKKAGIDLEASGVKSWSYTGKMVFWTTIDISNLPAGTNVPIMRYNTELKTYTVWNAVVTSNTVTGADGKSYTYNILKEGSNGEYSESAALNPSDKQSSAQAYKWYQNAMKEYDSKSN